MEYKNYSDEELEKISLESQKQYDREQEETVENIRNGKRVLKIVGTCIILLVVIVIYNKIFG